MTDNELLLALSNLFDQKLDPIREDIAELKVKMDSLETKMISLEHRMDSLEAKVDSLERRMDSLEDKVASLESNVISLTEKTSTLDTRTKIIELQLENEFLPRLKTIESCYTSTYDRYKNGVIQIEVMQEDVNTLKTVVAEHSKILQKIS